MIFVKTDTYINHSMLLQGVKFVERISAWKLIFMDRSYVVHVPTGRLLPIRRMSFAAACVPADAWVATDCVRPVMEVVGAACGHASTICMWFVAAPPLLLPGEAEMPCLSQCQAGFSPMHVQAVLS